MTTEGRVGVGSAEVDRPAPEKSRIEAPKDATVRTTNAMKIVDAEVVGGAVADMG